MTAPFSQTDTCGTEGQEPETSDAMRELRQQVIEDVIRYARTAPWRRFPRETEYTRASGRRFPKGTIAKLGGWIAICREAGVRPLPVVRKRVKVSRKERRRQIVEDIIQVATAIKHNRMKAFTVRLYREAGGLYGVHILTDFGWSSLCKAAKLVPGNSGRGDLCDVLTAKNVKKDRQKPTRSIREVEAALNQLLGLNTKKQSNFRNILGGAPRGRRIVDASIDRADVIADLRDISIRLGLSSPRELDWETYYHHGGKYHADQLIQFGGFTALTRP